MGVIADTAGLAWGGARGALYDMPEAIARNTGDFIGSSAGNIIGGTQRWYNDAGANPGRLGRAAMAIEEAEQIRKDAREILVRAKIELARRQKLQASAGKYLRAGMMG